MELLFLVGTMWLLLLLVFAINFDTRRPLSTNLKYKYRVKDNSIFRKIIKFKDKENYPCNYFKIVPIYIFLLLSIISLILLFVEIFSGGIVTNIVSKKIIIIITSCILVISIIYFLIINIWWEIVDYKEMKFTKQENNELKKIKKILKETRIHKK